MKTYAARFQALFRLPDYRWLWLTSMATSLGSWIFTFVSTWQIYAFTHATWGGSMVLATTMPGIFVNRLKEGLPMLDISTASNSCMIFMVGFSKSPNVFVRRHRAEVFYISGSAADVLRTLNMYQPNIEMFNMDAPEAGGVGMLLRLRTAHPDTRIFSVSASDKYLEPSVRLGHRGTLIRVKARKRWNMDPRRSCLASSCFLTL